MNNNLSFLDEINSFLEFFRDSKYCEDARFLVNVRESPKELLLFKNERGEILFKWRWVEKANYNILESLEDSIRFEKRTRELIEEKIRNENKRNKQ